MWKKEHIWWAEEKNLEAGKREGEYVGKNRRTRRKEWKINVISQIIQNKNAAALTKTQWNKWKILTKNDSNHWTTWTPNSTQHGQSNEGNAKYSWSVMCVLSNF